MTIICENLSELKLLVESIDLTRISDQPRFVAGWGTAGVIITDKAPSIDNLLPLTGDRKTGADINGSDKIIVTPYPKEFSWFATLLINSQIEDCVKLLSSDLPYAHLAFYTDWVYKNGKSAYKIKDELLYLCDWFIKRAESERASDKQK